MTQEQKDLLFRDKIKDNTSLESSLAKMRHELKMTQLKLERESLELERKHELEMLKLRGGCLGRLFGCC